jgi:hypothetical protein
MWTRLSETPGRIRRSAPVKKRREVIESMEEADVEIRGHGGTEREPGNEEERAEAEDSSLITHHSLLAQSSAPSPQIDLLRAELGEARTRGLQAHRRALLAENAGRVVPELVAGSTEEEMDESIEIARRAFEAARAAALAEVAATPVPAGNPVRQGPSLEGMSPIEKIAYGLKRES